MEPTMKKSDHEGEVKEENKAETSSEDKGCKEDVALQVYILSFFAFMIYDIQFYDFRNQKKYRNK